MDPQHSVSSLFNLVNVPSAVWIDEAGRVRRIDEGTYATTHAMGDFEFGREDYAPMVVDWVMNGEASEHLAEPGTLQIAAKSHDAQRAEAAFQLGSYFKASGQDAKADEYWTMAQQLNPDSWNYHRQDWSYTPEEAGPNWQKKVQTLGDQPYYKPISGLDGQSAEQPENQQTE